MIWLLTLYLAGVPIYEERDAQWHSRRDCMNRGWELARVYQQDHLIVTPYCSEEKH